MRHTGQPWSGAFRAFASLAVCTLATTSSFALEGSFNHPTYKKLARLDQCYVWGRYCGKMAADTYCRAQGYERSLRFDTEPARPTRLASDGRVCDADFCVGFKRITCYTSAEQRGKGGNWPQRID
ncbi:hypothetical protein [Variovorax saccharolyticus]|uniref:hypothetical protein n=1 Tax=Variovorax saccharolyticus TaxID=3053516 RepID=UPI002576B3B6|nr:hypothetical protein [Variovorax sp. J22R187]MDM0017338.1 hypothetical protein [Variovorax sp. J22R187]